MLATVCARVCVVVCGQICAKKGKFKYGQPFYYPIRNHLERVSKCVLAQDLIFLPSKQSFAVVVSVCENCRLKRALEKVFLVYQVFRATGRLDDVGDN